MKFFSSKFLLLVLLMLGLMISACKKDEKNPTGNNDNSGYPSDQTTFTNVQEAKIWVDATTDQALAFMDIAEGFTFKPTAPQDTMYYDGSWWHQEGSLDYTGYLMNYEYLYQFLSNGTPQQQSNGADEMNTKMDLQGTFDLSESGTPGSLDLHYTLDMNIKGLNTGTYLMNGGGVYDYSVTTTVSGITQTLHYYMAYTYNDLQVPANGGCPTGEIVVDARPYLATVTFDGTTTAHVVIKKDGNVETEYDRTVYCN